MLHLRTLINRMGADQRRWTIERPHTKAGIHPQIAQIPRMGQLGHTDLLKEFRSLQICEIGAICGSNPCRSCRRSIPSIRIRPGSSAFHGSAWSCSLGPAAQPLTASATICVLRSTDIGSESLRRGRWRRTGPDRLCRSRKARWRAAAGQRGPRRFKFEKNSSAPRPFDTGGVSMRCSGTPWSDSPVGASIPTTVSRPHRRCPPGAIGRRRREFRGGIARR